MTAPADVASASRDFILAASQLSTLVDLDLEVMGLWVLLTQVEDATWTDEERADLELRLEEATQQQLTKVESYVGLIKKLDALAEYDDAEANRLKERRDRKRRSVAYLKLALLAHMSRTGQDHLETGRYTVALRTNPPAVNVLEQQMIPAGFLRHIPEQWEPNKRSILDHYRETGEIPPGVEITRGTSLRIT